VEQGRIEPGRVVLADSELALDEVLWRDDADAD
jgi:hypothetical protein